MQHPNETMLQQLYERFGQGDLAGVLALCHDDIVFLVPGTSPLAGTYTKATFAELIGKVMQISGATFGERPVALIASDDHGAAILDHWMERDGKRIEYRTDHIWGIRDGKCSSWLERPGDEAAFNRAWS